MFRITIIPFYLEFIDRIKIKSPENQDGFSLQGQKHVSEN
jgi:hypothetical protein